MTSEYKFFFEFFDGQIKEKEKAGYQKYKIWLFSIISAVGFFLAITERVSIISLLVLELGLLWNVYVKFNSKLSNMLSIVVAFLYFYVACRFSLFANCLIYVAVYIPLQQIATSKDYSEGNYIQIKKSITESNRWLLFIFFCVTYVGLMLYDYAIGANFVYLDAISASLLVFSALLRNERYFEHYIVRFFALGASIVLWIFAFIEFGGFYTICIIIMYSSYLVFDVSSFVYDLLTYKNQMTIRIDEAKKQEKERLVIFKLDEYTKLKNDKK